jgi:hypothetical protein
MDVFPGWEELNVLQDDAPPTSLLIRGVKP